MCHNIPEFAINIIAIAFAVSIVAGAFTVGFTKVMEVAHKLGY